MIFNEAGNLMTVVAMPITDGKEVLPRLFGYVWRNNIGVLVELLGVRDKSLFAPIAVTHYVFEVFLILLSSFIKLKLVNAQSL